MWTDEMRAKYKKPWANTPDKAARKRAYDEARYEAIAEKKRRQANEWYAANKERVLAAHKENYAADPEGYCAKQKAYNEAMGEKYRERVRQQSRKQYAKDPAKALALSKAATRRARERDPEKFLRKSRERYWKDPEKSRERGVMDAMNRRARKMGDMRRVTTGEFEILWGRQRGCCALCHYPLGSDTPHKDHWMPLARGGAHTLENLRLLHPACNLKKWAKLPSEVIPQPTVNMEKSHVF